MFLVLNGNTSLSALVTTLFYENFVHMYMFMYVCFSSINCRPFGYCAEFLVERVYEEFLIPVVVRFAVVSLHDNTFIILLSHY